MNHDHYCLGVSSVADMFKLTPKEKWREERSRERWHKRYGLEAPWPGEGTLSYMTTPYALGFLLDEGDKR